MKQPLVSIALCTYNGEKYLAEQLNSLVNQTYRNLEIVVVDDCSKDGTIAILKEYGLKHPNIKIYQNEYNLGYAKNFEKSILLCTGDFISLSDQDDVWDLEKIQLLVETIGTNDIIYHDSQFIDQEGNLMNLKISDKMNMYEGNSPIPLLFYNCVSGHAIMFKRYLIAKFVPFPNSFYHDWWMAFVSTSYGSLKYYDKTLVKYRQHIHSNTDVLNIKRKPHTKKNKEKIRGINIKWLMCCATKNSACTPLVKEIISCFDENKKLNRRFKLFCLLLKNYKNVFYIKKKSNISKLNYIRQICFS